MIPTILLLLFLLVILGKKYLQKGKEFRESHPTSKNPYWKVWLAEVALKVISLEDSPRGREGIIKLRYRGTSPSNKGRFYSVIIEVEEVEQIDEFLTKIKILSISGVRHLVERDSVTQDLGTIVPTRMIRWKDSLQQELFTKKQ